MANTITVQVSDLQNVLLVYNKIKVYKASAIDGTYLEITDSGSRPTLTLEDNLYFYTDVSGIPTDYYKTSYFNSGTSAESTLSDPPSPASSLSTIQLTNNMQVVITLDGSIADTDGNLLGDTEQFFFTTKYDPYYSTVRKVRLEIGTFIQNINDEAINLAIFEASLMADQLSWHKSTSDFYKFARKEWTTCTASMYLLNNFLTGLKSKKLDNLEVQYELQKPAELMMKKVQDCIDKWEKEIKSGGHAVQTPVGFIKGECDPEAPHVGRMWEKGPYVQKIGMSNLRYRPWGARRYIGGYRRMYSRLLRNL